MKRFRMPSPGVLLGMIAVILALAGTAIAAENLRLADFEPSSRDRLAGTGVIQYAAQSHNTGDVNGVRDLKTFSVQCAAEKKATSGGFKWTGPNVPGPEGYEFLDSYPTGGGFVVRIYIENGPAPGGSAENQNLSVYSNCVKSRRQDGTPPS